MAVPGPLVVKAGPAVRDDPLELRCLTCAAEASLPLADPVLFRDAAKAFFQAHADCVTSIDLDGRRLRGWVS